MSTNIFLVVLFLQVSFSSILFAQEASGYVFIDQNKNGIKDKGEKGLPDISVSNGIDVVQTNNKGKWKLPVTDDTGFFVIRPTNYTSPLSINMLPQYYYLHKPNGSPKMEVAGVEPTGKLPKSIDFSLLYKPELTKFSAIFFGDTQTKNLEEVDYMNHDIVEDLIGSDAQFGIILGDIVGDDVNLFKDISEGISQIGVPWYYIFGNHDNNRDASENKYSDETFENYFGPSTYAFEVGEVVFVGFNTIYFDEKGKYKPHFSKDQAQFLKKYLRFVPDEKLVVLMMHTPIFTCENKDLIFEILKNRSHTFSISGHVHDQINVFVDNEFGWNGKEPHHHLINATVCGSWWSGQKDELGIPHATMNDGAPNGHSIITFDGNTYKVRFKAARRPADYQMNIYFPDKINIDFISQTKVLVNVFAGSDKSVVQMKVGNNDNWVSLKKVNQPDPEVQRMHELSSIMKTKIDGQEIEKTLGWSMDKPSISRHIWEGYLPKGLKIGPHTIKVKTTDMYGQSWEDLKIIYLVN